VRRGGVDPLGDIHGRDFAVRVYNTHLKTVLKRSAHTVNAHIAALDHFYDHLGLGAVRVRRDRPPKRASRALDAKEQKRFLRAVERRPNARDRAIGRLLFYGGVRISELVALDVEDVPLSARKGRVLVRSGEGEISREIPLTDPTARQAMTAWKKERAIWLGAETPALFLNRRGGRLTARAVDQFLDELAIEAGLVDENGRPNISAHTLRHTFATHLLRDGGVDIVVVAELLGHARLDTTRLYTLPNNADLESAVAKLLTDQ
jgi:site-specific recombinase XerD